MNILVTGGSGQLGCCIKKISPAYPQHNFIFTDMPEADITDGSCIERIINAFKADAVVNCAAYTAVDRAETEVELCRKINAEGPEVLAKLAKTKNIPLIHISTDYVFNGMSCKPLHETHITGPVGVYGKTKLQGELAISESGCNVAIIRTSWLYSEFGVNFVKTMLRLGKERESINVVYDQVGTPTYGVDLARAIMDMVKSGITGCEIYHYSNEGVISWYDFAHKIFELEKCVVRVHAIESEQFPTPAKRPLYSVMSKDKIKKKGILVPYWEDSLKICLNELKKNNN